MLSKATIKFIKSLQVKKYRKQEQCFIVEGAKSVRELLQSDFEVVMVLGTDEFLGETKPTRGEVIDVNARELERLGEFQTNNTALAIARMKENTPVAASDADYILALDNIRDPGNLGTIVRIADWYGIDKLVANFETADFYSPKVITASMGSFTRVQIYYCDLLAFIEGVDVSVYGAVLDGVDVHETNFDSGGIIVIGSESHGISKALLQKITHPITIPRYGGAESLNAAIATAVICDNLRRRQ